MNAVRGCRNEFGRLALTAMLLLVGSGACLALPEAAVSGVVRDSRGAAQMGAMVQVLAGPVNVATVFTDLYGRYRIANLIPGKYEIRASAALFLPAMRSNLRLANGARATVNLTLSMLSDPVAWIPAQRRHADEPADDWGWTMRASANRPILRMDEGGEVVLVSSSTEGRPAAPPMQARASLLSGDGGFGGGGSHNVLTLDRVMLDGSSMVLRSDIGTARTPYGRGPSVEFDAGFEHRSALGGAARLVVSYASHPELMNAGGALGMQTIRLASAQRMRLGDTVDVEAGGTVYAIRTTGAAFASRPFLAVSLHPGEVWTLGYRLATSRDLQQFDSLDSLDAGVPIAVPIAGRLQTEAGMHQEVAVSRKVGPGILRAAAYRDSNAHPLLSGTGVMAAADLAFVPGNSSGVVADTVTDGFQLLGRAYHASGVSVMLSEPLSSGIWAALEYQDGEALQASLTDTGSLAAQLQAMRPVRGEAITGAVKGRVIRAGTTLRASYRWQPTRLVTPIAGYEAFSDQPYLSFNLRQSVRLRGLLPPGLEATIDVTNLLAQGYQPFLSADGRTLYLAQAPRAIQAGLSFTF
ncbi:MAG: TonB-dependent receptor [Acidobacteriota bacterium]|nr:TonB-dependent receptor [Acidobacteriota bacterium]